MKVHDEDDLRGVTGCLPTASEGGWGIVTEGLEVGGAGDSGLSEEEEVVQKQLEKKIKKKRESIITGRAGMLTGTQKDKVVDGDFMKLRRGKRGGIREKMEVSTNKTKLLRGKGKNH